MSGGRKLDSMGLDVMREAISHLEDSTELCGNRNICSDFEAGMQSSVGDVWRAGIRLPHPSVGTSFGRVGAAERP